MLNIIEIVSELNKNTNSIKCRELENILKKWLNMENARGIIELLNV